MKTFTNKIVAVAAVFAVVQAHPQGGLHFASLNPTWTVKRALYNLDKVSDQGQKDKLTQGLKDAVTIAAKVLEKMDDDAHKDKLGYWFGDKKSGENEKEIIRQVYKNFVGSNSDGTGADTLGQVLVFSDDYWKPTDRELPGVGDGNTAYCSLEKDGKTGAAYYKSTADKKPGMHYCDKVFDRTNLETLTKDSCAKLGDHISTAVWTKNFIGANVLHEFMHYPRVGKDAVGTLIGDTKYDAYQCRVLATNSDLIPNDPDGKQWKERTIINADTYVWYALDIAFQEICKKTFSGPRDERDDDETNQDWPDSNPDTDETWDGNCNYKREQCERLEEHFQLRLELNFVSGVAIQHLPQAVAA
ncbi:hypothetical protein SLS60_000201 [Paraconiothyrium brasiliense]|uniref:Peptidase domain-containing protein n=1 Tax=Paraconiothyrium brasiliense TaxID=300254 RepID=A0ABR3S5M0_9PLEO